MVAEVSRPGHASASSCSATSAIDSMTDFRNRKRRGELREDPFGDVFLVIDGWLNFRQEFEMHREQVVNIAAQGLSYGVHVIVAANRWAEIRPAMKDLLGTRFELRLGDPSESEIDRRVAVNVPEGRPGRGLSRTSCTSWSACRASTARATPQDVARGRPGRHREDQRGLAGPAAPQVRLLPELLPYEELLAQDGRAASPAGPDRHQRGRAGAGLPGLRRRPALLRAAWTASPARRTCCARSSAASSSGTPRRRR